jgi:hypothetical protein
MASSKSNVVLSFCVCAMAVKLLNANTVSTRAELKKIFDNWICYFDFFTKLSIGYWASIFFITDCAQPVIATRSSLLKRASICVQV